MKNSGSINSESIDSDNSLSDSSERVETNSATENTDELALSESFPGALSPEDVKRLKAAQKRNFIFALIFGVILLVLGYFAGGNVRKAQDLESTDSSSGQIIVFTENAIDAEFDNLEFSNLLP
ncbi:MAG: hypothetical protein SPG61_03835 [Arcanobacterium sp.]|nr:hypothetical protein [Arcanobacterium sp.]